MAPCNWDYIMYSTQGALSWWTWLLHIPMAFFGVYLLMNLTIATLVICFNKSYAKMNLKAMSAGNRLQTNDRDDDVFGPEKFPSQSSSSWFHSVRLVCKRIQATRTFELVIISVILLNVVALSIVW